MKLKRLDPPVMRSQKAVSLYDQLITPDMVHMTRAHPGETFALVDDTERLMTFDKNQVGRIRAKAPSPIHFISRAVPGRPGKFSLYLAWDQRHWARVDTHKKEK